MKTRYLLTLLAIFLLTSDLHAQDELEDDASPLSISGSIDAYFRYNLNAKNSGTYYETPGTSFGNLPGFSLGMLNLVTSYEGKKVGFVADLVFGPRGEEAVFASPYYSSSRGSSQMINQLYTYWNVNDILTLTMGNFNTFLGYEVISPVANFNYSTSYMFSYGPFSHTGIKADLILADNVTLMAAVMNPTDLTEFNPFGTYTTGIQIGFFGSTYINLLYGDQDGKLDNDMELSPGDISDGATFQIDITTGFDVSEIIYVGFNTTYNSTSSGELYFENNIKESQGDGAGFFGAAAYLQMAASDAFEIGTRLEYFQIYNYGIDPGIVLDDNGDGNIMHMTLTGRASIANLVIIPELRIDATFEDNYFNSNLKQRKNLSSFILAAVYSF